MEQPKQDTQRAQHIYDSFMRDWGSSVENWQMFYEKMAQSFKAFQGCGCFNCASANIYLNRAFLLAMEELPDEGDIVKIVERMARILSFESIEKLGLELVEDSQEARTPAERLRQLTQAASTANGLFRAIVSKVGMEHPEATDDVSEVAPPATYGAKKRVVH